MVSSASQMNAERLFTSLFQTCDTQTYSALFSLFRKIDKGEVEIADILSRNKDINQISDVQELFLKVDIMQYLNGKIATKTLGEIEVDEILTRNYKNQNQIFVYCSDMADTISLSIPEFLNEINLSSV
jgi:hypothetical protein